MKELTEVWSDRSVVLMDLVDCQSFDAESETENEKIHPESENEKSHHESENEKFHHESENEKSHNENENEKSHHESCFGKLSAWLYSIEFQKRGLPHAHILLWLSKDSKIRPENIDYAVSAEIPDIQTDPGLFEIVKKNMIHGPCGENNPTAPCMKNGTCSKGFPKSFIQNIEIGNDSYPKYRRRSPNHGGQELVLDKTTITSKIDSRWVVPYNPLLLRLMNCHLNVELCSSVKSIKYVLKYVHKGCDQATFKVTEQATRDEVSDFINARYIGSTEAAWRIFSMPMHERFPPVMQMAVHLENGQRVYFTEENAHEKSVSNAPDSTLTALFAVMIIHCDIYNLMDLWTTHCHCMCEDFLTRLNGNESGTENAALVEIENMVMDMGGSMLTQYGLPEPQQEHFERIGIDYQRKTCYDIEKERHISNQNRNLLNEEQRIVHDSFVASALSATSGIFFLDVPGGCGKTFLIQTILATIRSQNKIVIATVSSGLAATLLSAGRTIHSTFKVPLNLTNVDQPICSIKKGTSLARLIKECCAIVIDEAPMTNKLVFEALHRSLCDITGKNEPMGGIATLLCGDFRQILPVVVGGTRANIVNSCIKSSMLWSCITPLQLRTNMRVYLSGSTEAGIFADMLLSLGDGLIPVTENPDTIPVHQFGIIVQTTKQ
ncbi:ATP-dependent DNA helicase PIF1 [Elysia marginata]|uniref:ATP-dependent DNA helicase n=1 Tax=Elysia marginata TaxID=1093978 RepID=A0AAV4J4B8_9GAST|nr:ATP-dependent DNA helicase PIF1 [Elysia marginata]